MFTKVRICRQNLTHDLGWHYDTDWAKNMKLLSIPILLCFLLKVMLQETRATPSNLEESGGAPSIYDRDPKHIWNRLYDVFFIRKDQTNITYGMDTLDPLLWLKTEHLLAGPSHKRALSILDEFLLTHAENQIRDPSKRALLQHNLWAVFDWSSVLEDHLVERRELQFRLAEVLRRLAVTPEEIKLLPDNYAQAVASRVFAGEYDPANRDRPFLPPDLLQPQGPWVCIRGNAEPVAEAHVGEFSGRSRFLVFVHLPQGRKATLEYLQTVWNVPEPWVTGELDVGTGTLNPRLPQFPVGTQVALVRQMALFGREGKLVAAPITESVQIRVYRAIPARHDQNNVSIDWPAARTEQDFYEIRLSQAKLFAGQAGGLRAVARGEKEFPVFRTQGEDIFETAAKENTPLEKLESPSILDMCAACHSAPGINSLQSRRRLLKPNRPQLALDLGRNPDDAQYGPLWWEAQSTLGWKANQYNWGLLNGYWQATKGTH
jgi:hypothetical protein